MIPKNMLQDKERLYEELYQTKLQLNQYQIKNYQLNTRIISLEEELQKFGKHSDPAEGQNILNSLANSQLVKSSSK